MAGLVSGIIGIDPGIRRLLTCSLVADNLIPAKTWSYDAGAAMQKMARGLSGDEAVGLAEIHLAKADIFALYHLAAKEIVQVAVTYHCRIAMESPPEAGSFPSSWVPLGKITITRAPTTPGAVMQILPLQGLFDDLVSLCRRVGLEEPLSIAAVGSSHICGRCHKEDWQGRTLHDWYCHHCGYLADADDNAAHIIGIRGWSTHLGQGGQGPAVVINQRLLGSPGPGP